MMMRWLAIILIFFIYISLIAPVVIAQEDDDGNGQEETVLNPVSILNRTTPDKRNQKVSQPANVNLSNGSFSYRIPLEIVPGTRSMQPQLALVYNSDSPRGNAGKGWNLSLPKIVRSTKYGADQAQNWTPEDAVYIYDGVELVTDGHREIDEFGCQAIRYYRKIDRYERITFCVQTTVPYWLVTKKNGTRMSFGRRLGLNDNSQLRGQSPLPGRSPINAYEYYLDEVVNTHGLSWRAFYSQLGDHNNDGEIDSHDLVENSAPRLEKIQYTYYKRKILGEARIVDIIWELRPDGISSTSQSRVTSEGESLKPGKEYVEYRYGFPINHEERIARIEMKLGDEVVRKYELSYDADPSTATEDFSPDSKRSILNKVQLIGADGTKMPPLSFKYKFNTSYFYNKDRALGFTSVPARREFPHLDTRKHAPIDDKRVAVSPMFQHWNAHDGITNQRMADINGDGYLDVIRSPLNLREGKKKSRKLQSGKVEVFFGKGNGEFERELVVWGTQSTRGLRYLERPKKNRFYTHNLRHDMLDMNADGLPDFFDGVNFYRNTGESGEDKGFEQIIWGGRVAPYREELSYIETPRSYGRYRKISQGLSALIDGNGDGCPDKFEVSDGKWYFFRNKACDLKSPSFAFALPILWKFGVDLPRPQYLSRINDHQSSFEIPNPPHGGKVVTYSHLFSKPEEISGYQWGWPS